MNLVVFMIESLESNIECIVLIETREITEINLFNMAGYDMLYNESPYNQSDGVVVYMKSQVKVGIFTN